MINLKSLFHNKEKTYREIIAHLYTLNDINSKYTNKLIKIKKQIIDKDNYLKKDYTLRKTDARMINYNRYLFDEINLSIRKIDTDIGPEDDLNSLIANKVKVITKIIKTKNDKIYNNLNKELEDSQIFMEKIKKKDRDIKNKEKDIKKINQHTHTYLEGFQRFKECETFKKFSEENRKDIRNQYKTIEIEYDIAKTIYLKRTLSLSQIRIINTKLLNIDDPDYCFEKIIDSIKPDEMLASFQNILGYIRPDGTFHFHREVQNMIKHISDDHLLNPDELNTLKQLSNQTFKP